MKPWLRVVLMVCLGAFTNLCAGPNLIKAAAKGKLNVVRELVSAGENINESDNCGWTPLMWASYYQHLSVLECLLEKGADPNIQATSPRKGFSKGASALIIACYYGMEDVAAALVRKKARVDLTDEAGRTALDYAFESRSPLVQKLLEQGGDGSPRQPKAYTRVALERFTAVEFVNSHYSDAVIECQAHTMMMVMGRGGFERVEIVAPGNLHDPSTLLVQVEITDIRLPSSGARVVSRSFCKSSMVDESQ